MKEGPNVNDEGASAGLETEYVTALGEEGS